MVERMDDEKNDPESTRRPPPRRGFRPLLAALFLRLGGWRAEGDPPDVPRCVIIAAPHTYWWDGFWMMMFAWYWGLSISFMVKRSTTRGPLGWMVRWAGAVPVDRSAAHGLVGELVRAFAERPRLFLSIPPEGTRARREYWKSGFYHIARQANVPLCLSYLDYGRGRGGFGPCFLLSGDVRKDMDRIREFYRDVRGRYPERFTAPRLKEESGASDSNPAGPRSDPD